MAERIKLFILSSCGRPIYTIVKQLVQVVVCYQRYTLQRFQRKKQTSSFRLHELSIEQPLPLSVSIGDIRQLALLQVLTFESSSPAPALQNSAHCILQLHHESLILTECLACRHLR
jgi:hypothetical protein